MTLLDLCDAPAPEGDDFVARVARHFLARPGQWINATDLEHIGGRQAWRTRVSDARKRYGLTIENRVRTVYAEVWGEGRRAWRVSEYRYLPGVERVA